VVICLKRGATATDLHNGPADATHPPNRLLLYYNPEWCNLSGAGAAE